MTGVIILNHKESKGDLVMAGTIVLTPEQREIMEEALARLNEDDRTIIQLYYGLNPDRTAYTMDEIAIIYGVSEEGAEYFLQEAMKSLEYVVKHHHQILGH